MELPITNGFYESHSKPLSAQQCVNWYPVTSKAPALASEVLFGTPGIAQKVTTGASRQWNRGARTKNGVPYFVNGGALYRLNSDYSYDSLGEIEGLGRVSMQDNGTQLMILVPGGKGYIYDESAGTPFQEITDTDFYASGNPQYVEFIDGYFVCSTDSKKFIICNLNDGLAWGALDFGSAESDPDAVVAPIVLNGGLYMLGSITTEGFQNVGGYGFPFQRSNLVIDKGCFAPFSLVATNSTFFMIGGGKNESPAVWQFIGSSFQKVSTEPIDSLLQRFSEDEIAGAYALSYGQQGAYFMSFTVPGIDQKGVTVVYDLATQKWHERSSDVEDEDSPWRVSSVVTAYGAVLVGDTYDGRLGALSLDTYTEYENNIVRVASTQPFANQGDPIAIPSLELTMEAGVGNDGVVDPQVSLSWSKDGHTFSPERSRSIGKKGEYTRRTIWSRLGQFPRFAVLRFRLSDPVKPVIIKLEAK